LLFWAIVFFVLPDRRELAASCAPQALFNRWPQAAAVQYAPSRLRSSLVTRTIKDNCSFERLSFLFCLISVNLRPLARRRRYLIGGRRQPRRSMRRLGCVQVLSLGPEIDKFRQKLVDFYFFTINSSLFTILSKLVD